MEKRYVIYKVTNSINGKVYVGKTYNFEKRKREHIYDIEDNLPFHRALKKYGIDNFVWEIIDTAESDEEIIEKEIYWIKQLNTCIYEKDSWGYNVTLGGEGGVSWNSRPVIQFSKNGYKINEFHSCAHACVETGIHRRGIEDCARGIYKTSDGFLWRFKDEWDGKPIEQYKKQPSHRCVEVVQIDLGGKYLNKFSSVTEAAKKTGIGRTLISSCLNGKNFRAGGYIWVYLDDYNPEKDYKYQGIRIGKGIYQLDDSMNIIKHFNNCVEAAVSLGLPKKVNKQIHKSLTKKHKCHGYYWRKAEEIDFQNE